MWLSQSCSFGFIHLFWCYYLFHSGFPLLGSSLSCCFCLHWLSNSKRNAFLHHTGYFHADYDSLYNNLRGEIFYGRVSLNSVLLLLLLNFLIMSRLGLMYISPIINIGSDLTHLPGFQLLGLPLKEITFFVCANKINLLTLKYSLYRLVLLAKWF